MTKKSLCTKQHTLVSFLVCLLVLVTPNYTFWKVWIAVVDINGHPFPKKVKFGDPFRKLHENECVTHLYPSSVFLIRTNYNSLLIEDFPEKWMLGFLLVLSGPRFVLFIVLSHTFFTLYMPSLLFLLEYYPFCYVTNISSSICFALSGLLFILYLIFVFGTFWLLSNFLERLLVGLYYRLVVERKKKKTKPKPIITSNRKFRT